MLRYMILGGAALAACGILVGLLAIKDSGVKPPQAAPPPVPQPVAGGAGAPESFGAAIWRLYEQGKLDDARKELKRLFQSEYDAYHKPRPKSDKPTDVESKVAGGGGAASLVCGAMVMEAKYGEPGLIPAFLMDMAEKAIDGLDRGAAFAQEYLERPGHERLAGHVALVIDTKMAILASMAEAHAKAGKAEMAAPMLAKHAAFLEANKEAFEKMRGSYRHSISPPPPKAEVPKETIAAIQAVIEEHYKALATEDSNAIGRSLVQGEGLKNGQDIVGEIAAERERQKDFDRIGPAVFDKETRITVTPLGGNRYAVRVQGIMKTFYKGAETIRQRESDRFTVVVTEGKPLLLFEKRRPK
jgi:hypothetical protein